MSFLSVLLFQRVYQTLNKVRSTPERFLNVSGTSCAVVEFITVIMSNFGDESDSEVDRIMMDRPPSSYGSMQSDDHEDELDEFEEPPLKLQATRVRLNRPDSPETVFTERTNTNQSSVYKDGLVLRTQTFMRAEESHALHSINREPSIVEPSELQSDIQTEAAMDEEPNYRDEENNERDAQEQRNESAAMEQEEATKEEEEEDFDEIVVSYAEPIDPPPPPREGDGLQFQHLHGSLTLQHVLRQMVGCLSQFHPAEISYFKRSLSTHCRFRKNYPSIADLHDPLDLVDKMIEVCGLGEALHLTIRAIHNVGKEDLSVYLRKTCRRAVLQHDLILAHERRYYSLYEGRCRPGRQRYISDVYVEPVTVIRGSREPINLENEVQRVPYTIEETQIRAADIFRPLPHEQKPIRTVMMTGVPASGLTVAVNKVIIDWLEKKTNQDFQLVFPLPAKELHLGKDEHQSFLEMLSCFFAEAEDIKFIEKPDCLSLFIIDALELCRHDLDFKNNKVISSARVKAPLDALLTSLIKGTLLPNARVWITSHVSAAHRIPPQLIDRYVELRGFTDEKKEEYFTKRTSETELGRKVYNHMKRSKALEIMCHHPLFSWMVAFIFERGFRDPEYGKHPPGITAFYSQFIVVQMNRAFEKYRGCSVEAQKWKEEDKTFIEMMGKMSYKMLLDGRDRFTVADLAAVNLTYEDLRDRDELTTEVKRRNENVQTWIFKFVHFTVQEYMAAMYAYVAFRKDGKNVIEPSKMSWLTGSNKDRPVIELYRPAVDRALASPNGHLDMFLRFLVGLVTPGTEDNLRGYLLNHYHPKAKGTEEVAKYINKKMRDGVHPDRRRNLELCLVELEEGKEER
ncbi:NLR family CARD domain-containing protein 3 [Puntigrus tetrazona]|uniref:NLR family CARD domain-containing protein 3 n=1 Tax=Puntigrus tetrazona TaxID=1606681 RepID=UPI001C8AFB45|nr:NLR family CARD domain-containing protein 3 [Puntigrus tetrazona]